MEVICPSAIESLVQIWTVLHKDLELEFDRAETRYLRGMAFGLDDELVARLLAAKLSLARRSSNRRVSQHVARRGLEILFSVQGRRHFTRLVHGSVDEPGLLGVGTRFGSALVGLRTGGSLLWPSEHGRLVEVRALRVQVPAFAPRSVSPTPQTRVACASG